MLKTIDKLVERLLKRLLLPLRGKAPYATRVLPLPGSWPRDRMLLHCVQMALGLGAFAGVAVGLLLALLTLALLPRGIPWFVSSVITVGVMAALAAVARSHFSKIRNHQIGYYGERRVAEILERLGRPDWHVFHGFRPVVDKFGNRGGDIDHVIVCPHGVFCVETKALRKLPNERGNKLIYTPPEKGKSTGALRYPSGREIPHNPLPKFQGKVYNLHKQLLTRKCGGHGYVARIVIFPEWEVEREASDKWEFPCSEEDEIREFIRKSEVRLESEQIKKIAGFFDKELRKTVEELH